MKFNINPEIETGFRDFIVDGVNIPIEYQRYEGKASSYLEYYTWLIKPDNYSDDTPKVWIVYGTLDVYSKGNFKNILQKAVERLLELGFSVTDIEKEDYDDDTKYYHIPINFYK